MTKSKEDNNHEPVYKVYALKYAGPLPRKMAMVRWLQGFDIDIQYCYYIWAIQAENGDTFLFDTGTSAAFGRDLKEMVERYKITNYVANTARRFEYVVGIRYSDDADEAIEIIKDLIEEHPIALKNPSATVFVDNLGDNAVNIIVRIWAPPIEWYDLKMEMLWKIKKGLEENGIEIAFPQRTVWLANELRKHEVG